jgi:thiol:disulfide interchange protein DsbA
MKKMIFALLLGVSLFSYAQESQEQDNEYGYEAGIDYVVLDKSVKTTTGNKIEVRELFWYMCPHCQRLELLLDDWKKTLPNNVEFIQQPAVFSQRWAQGAIFYYVLDELNLTAKLHSAFFNAIHLQGKRFNSEENFVNWVAGFGVEAEKVRTAFNSFSVRVKLNKSTANTSKYNINSTRPRN